MMSTMRKLLSALLALCMFAGGMPALGEGLETDGTVDVGILAEPVEDSREEREIDLWTEEMDEAGPQERAVSAVGGGLGVYAGFSTIYILDDAFAALNMDPEDFGNKTQHRIETELSTSELVDGEYVESWVCSDLDVANLNKRGNYCTAIAQKPGKATITATTNKGRYGSAEITVERFDSFAIDAAHFPDDGFRSFLLQRYQYMILGDNLIWPELLQDEETLNLTGFKSLKGIEYFTGLKELYCSHFEGTSVDFSGNTNLEMLSMPFSSALQSVNLSGCTALEAVSFMECGLSSLNVSHCPDLYVLDCDYNELTRLDVSGCPKLRVLDASGNWLTELDVSHCPELLELFCRSGRSAIASLDISNCPTLVRCFQNGGILDESYAYSTERGNQFANDKKRFSYDAEKTSVIVNGVIHTPEPTPAPTPAPTPIPSAEAEIVSSNLYVIDPAGTGATFLGTRKTGTTLTIPDTITAKGVKIKVTAIADKALYKNTKLTTVSIGKNVKTIGKNAFYGCTKLKKLTGGAAVTTIGSNAFRNCKALTAITLNGKVKTIDASAFYGCKALKTVTIKTTKLTANTIGKNAFKGIYAKALFKCPKKKLKAYRALLPKKGAPKRAKYE